MEEASFEPGPPGQHEKTENKTDDLYCLTTLPLLNWSNSNFPHPNSLWLWYKSVIGNHLKSE
jgi:hypothetical protein